MNIAHLVLPRTESAVWTNISQPECSHTLMHTHTCSHTLHFRVYIHWVDYIYPPTTMHTHPYTHIATQTNVYACDATVCLNVCCKQSGASSLVCACVCVFERCLTTGIYPICIGLSTFPASFSYWSGQGAHLSRIYLADGAGCGSGGGGCRWSGRLVAAAGRLEATSDWAGLCRSGVRWTCKHV